MAAASKFAAGAGNCQIIGDPDVFGLGVRLGFYFQWATIVFATWIAPELVGPAQMMSNIVTISVYVNTFCGISESTVIAAEWWIVYFMTFVLSLGFVRTSTILQQTSRYSCGVSGVLWAMIIFGQCWLWFRGVDIGQKEGCTVKVFALFFAVDIQNKTWRTIFKIESVIGCVVAVRFLLYGLFNCLKNAAGKKGDNSTGDDSRDKVCSCKDEESVGYTVKAGLTALQLVFGTIAIVQIEMTMKVSNIDVSAAPLTSSGQLISLLMGIFNLAATFWAGVKKGVSRKKLCGLKVSLA